MAADDPDPPRKFYDFKSREFESVNAPTNEAQPIPPIDVHQLLRQANSAKPGGVAPATPAPAAPIPTANNVHATLQENVARANALGLNELKPIEKRPSRRKRDFLFLIITGNGICALLALIAGLNNPMVFVSAIAGMGLITAGLTWVMWFVMDDY